MKSTKEELFKDRHLNFGDPFNSFDWVIANVQDFEGREAHQKEIGKEYFFFRGGYTQKILYSWLISLLSTIF